MKQYLFFILLIFISFSVFATHNRAGEITVRQIDPNNPTYLEIKVVTYTYTESLANRPELEVSWGDNTSSIIPRIDTVLLPDNYRRNTYIGRHTFPGSGAYTIVMSDPNRNAGVDNIPNSVSVLFTIKTTIKIDSDLGNNSTPTLSVDPIDKAAVGRLFTHNPGASDVDGDSLSYKLSTCLGEYGMEILGYALPPASNTIYVNEITGDLVWDCPTQIGLYNIAMLIEEWREGNKISQIVRDMQIEVVISDNYPPNIIANDNYCVTAGDTLQFDVTATDQDGDYLTISASGGPLLLSNSPADFSTTSATGTVTSTFSWITNCLHVQKQHYNVIFRAQDHNPEVNLVFHKNVNIEVVCPAPVLDSIAPTSNTIKLYWHPSVCSNLKYYDIYRKISSYGFTPGVCETGVPTYTGYEFIDTSSSNIDTTYLDNDHGSGLIQGYQYCYMVVARFGDGAESYASNEICSQLVKGIPVITNVSVDTCHATQGRMYVAWSAPTEHDTILAPGPYKYLIYRSPDLWGENMVLIDSLSGINDTTYHDSLLNTLDHPSSYKIEFINADSLNRFVIGPPMTASSVWIDIAAADNELTLTFEKNTPWVNDQYIVYRYPIISDSIGFTYTETFKDSMLANGSEYCYQAKSIGGYRIDGYIDPIINWSHKNCGIPIDTVSPCSPVLSISGNCELMLNDLIWTNPYDSCSEDIIRYNIYYKIMLDDEFEFLTSLNNIKDTSYEHYPTLSMAGCYVVTAVDSFLNESAYSNRVCIDECTYYKLPNVFTPDGNSMNDLFIPGPYKFVEKVDMKIYNRWGVLIFETTDPDINWDGKYMENNKKVVDGVYYYICDVYEYHLTGIEPRTLVGFIHIFSSEKTVEP